MADSRTARQRTQVRYRNSRLAQGIWQRAAERWREKVHLGSERERGLVELAQSEAKTLRLLAEANAVLRRGLGPEKWGWFWTGVAAALLVTWLLCLGGRLVG